MPPHETRDYRLKVLEKQIEALENRLKSEYLNKYQLMSEYLSREENLRAIREQRQERREWPVIIGGAVIAACTLANLILQLH